MKARPRLSQCPKARPLPSSPSRGRRLVGSLRSAITMHSVDTHTNMTELEPGPLMIDIAGPELAPAERDMLLHPLVGGLILFTRNYESPQQLLELCAEVHALRSPPLLIAVDQHSPNNYKHVTYSTKSPSFRPMSSCRG